MKKIGIILVFIFVPIFIIALFYAGMKAYQKKKPGLYFKYKCDQTGDDTSKFYGDKWQARGAVCDGLYIPIGVKLEGKNYIDVLAKMGELYASDNTLKEDMKELAKKAVQQIA